MLCDRLQVKIISADGNRYVTLLIVKAEATLTSDGKLITQIDNQITPGKFQVTLIIEEPTTLSIEETPSENERSHLK